MTLIDHAVVVGVFHDRQAARKAVEELRRVGFAEDQIGVAAVGGALGTLVGLGVPEHEARYYEPELHAGRTLVSVRAPGRYEEASAILRRHGAAEAAPQG
jgi:hypothetical protein